MDEFQDNVDKLAILADEIVARVRFGAFLGLGVGEALGRGGRGVLRVIVRVLDVDVLAVEGALARDRRLGHVAGAPGRADLVEAARFADDVDLGVEFQGRELGAEGAGRRAQDRAPDLDPV